MWHAVFCYVKVSLLIMTHGQEDSIDCEADMSWPWGWWLFVECDPPAYWSAAENRSLLSWRWVSSDHSASTETTKQILVLDIFLSWCPFVPPNLFFPPWPADLLVWESSICTAVNQVIHPLPLHDVVQHQLPPHRLLSAQPWQNITEFAIMIWLFMALHILCS